MDVLCDVAILEQVPAFANLSARSLAAIQQTMQDVAIGRKNPLTLHVPPTTHYILSLSANLTLHRSAAVEFGMRLPQGVLWPIALTPDATVEIRCREDGRVGLLSADCVNQLMQSDADLRLAMLQAAIASQQHITLEIEQYMGNSLTGRVAHLLLQLAAEQNTIHYGHAHLASLLNAQRESVSIVVGRFRKAGWIRTRYGRIQLLDRAALNHLATHF